MVNRRRVSQLASGVSVSSSSTHTTDVHGLDSGSRYSISARVTYNGSGTSGADLKIYTSPDGDNWDTLATATKTLTLDAGNDVQATIPPSDGMYGRRVRADVVNNDSSESLTNVNVWVCELG